MIKNLSEFNDATYSYLYDIALGKGLDQILLEDNFIDDTADIIAYCSDNKYITNVDPWKDGNGKQHISYTGPVRITRDGLAFLEANSDTTIKKMKRDIFFANLKSWLSILIAAAALLVSIIVAINNLS